MYTDTGKCWKMLGNDGYTMYTMHANIGECFVYTLTLENVGFAY